MRPAAATLGILLSTGPEHPNLQTVLGLAAAALDRDVRPYLYLIDEGVRAVGDPRLRALAARGASLFVCAYGCQRRGRPLDADEPVTYCGLVTLSDLLRSTDRFLAFN